MWVPCVAASDPTQMTMANLTPTVPAPLALIPYAERFLEGRRVVIFGDATARLAEEAAERGARLVHVYDPDGARVAQAVATAPKGLTFSVYRDGGDAGLRDGAFEVCLIPDLSRFPDARALLALARKACAAGSILLAATPRVEGRQGESARGRPGPLNYYDFYAAIKQHFAAVKMVGQVPFQGYALVDFSTDGELEISVDASLTDGEDREPVAYVAIASDRRVAVDPYAIIQLPTEIPETAEAPEAPGLQQANEARNQANEARLQAETRLVDEQRRSAELGRALSEAGALPRQLEMRLTEEARRAEMLANQIQRAQESNERLLRENRTFQDRLQQSAKTLAEANAERARLAQREEGLQRKLREAEAIPRGVDPAKVDALRKRVEELESEKAVLLRHVSEIETQYSAMQRQFTELHTQYSVAHHQNHEHRVQLDAAFRQIEELKNNLQQQQQQVAAMQTQARRAAAQANEEQTEHVADLSAAETTLKERAREIAALRAEVDRRGSMVRELLQTLEARGASPLGPQADHDHAAHLERELATARSQLNRVSGLAMQREGELKSAREQNAHFQAQATRALASAQEEIQALRTALQQERAARAAAEAEQGEQNLPGALLEQQREQDPQG